MSKETGGPAFPRKRSLHRKDIIETCGAKNSDYIHDEPQGGMTLRDWFAGQAIAGLCNRHDSSSYLTDSAVAEFAYKLADAMLKERSKP